MGKNLIGGETERIPCKNLPTVQPIKSIGALATLDLTT